MNAEVCAEKQLGTTTEIYHHGKFNNPDRDKEEKSRNKQDVVMESCEKKNFNAHFEEATVSFTLTNDNFDRGFFY